MDQIATLLSQYWMWGMLLAAVIGLYSDKWFPLLKAKLSGKSESPDTPPADADVTDVLALHAIQARAKRSGCPDFQAGLKKVEECWFHVVTTEPAA